VRKAILVAEAIKAGSRLIDALRRSGVVVTAAFWRYYEEEDYWRLLIVTTQLSSHGPTALYNTLLQLLYDPNAQWTQAIGVDQVIFIPPTNLLYKHIKQGTGLSIATGQARNIVFEDAYVYSL